MDAYTIHSATKIFTYPNRDAECFLNINIKPCWLTHTHTHTHTHTNTKKEKKKKQATCLGSPRTESQPVAPVAVTQND